MEETNSTNQESDLIKSSSTNTNSKIKKELPNSTAILAIGISSIGISFCCCLFFWPLGLIGIFIGIVLSIIALIMAKKAKSTYEQNPELYKESSYQNMNAGKICAIIGLCLYGLCLIASIIVFLIWGAVFFANMPSNNFF
tara:strand:+ start:113 stop:532 length:420 start_codon:yes stop_codon:yes gene_type:complete